MSTLAVVEAILREAAMPLSVREIVERAGDALPTKSKTPDTVVARDLSMDIKKKSEASTFVRTSPGRYAIRELALLAGSAAEDQASQIAPASPGSVDSPATALPSPMTATAPTLTAPAPALAEPSAVATPLVGQSLPHERSGPRPAPAKGPSKSNSEDTPLSA